MQGTDTPRSSHGQDSRAASDQERQPPVCMSSLPCRSQGYGPSSALRGNPASVAASDQERQLPVSVSSVQFRSQGYGPSSASRGNPTFTGRGSLSSTSVPVSFQSMACRKCQGSGLPVTCTCELFQRWGSWVVVGRCERTGTERRADGSGGETSASSSVVDVVVDRDSMAGNPFVGGQRKELCEAYDELLGHILTSNIEFDRLARNYQRCIDEHRASTTSPASRLLLQGVASKHNVQLHCCAERFHADHVRAWVGFHAGLLRDGQCLRLLCHCVAGDCPLWSCHAQGLAGALTWAVTRLDLDIAHVRASPWLPAQSLHHACPSCTSFLRALH